MNKSLFTTVTPFSKFLALTILVVGPFAGFYLGTRYQKTTIPLPPVPVENTIADNKTDNEKDTAITGDSKIEEQFINSSFRVLKVVRSEDSSKYLIIATERSESTCGSPEKPSRCVNDTGCGGMYVSPTCYFFEEPGFVYGANPKTKFVGKYEGYAVDLDSFKFKGNGTVEFSAGFGDAGYGVTTKNSLNLSTGLTTQLSKEETNIELE